MTYFVSSMRRNIWTQSIDLWSIIYLLRKFDEKRPIRFELFWSWTNKHMWLKTLPPPSCGGDKTTMVRFFWPGPFLLSISVFSERELTFTFAICCRPSVRLSVCNDRAPYSGGSHFRQCIYGIRYFGHPLTSTENFMEIVQGEPLRRGS